ncbi:MULTISPECIES: hypothetical protein [Pseudomonas]|jgi:hypothetical protein|uniref:hypothetical protein n=1 Tax=Pseudomonas TaxID=286 RepID=UPI000CD42125|nr:hypothetical protein [Pseudomonas putida]POF97768.1 hypothetical protein BGP81_14050 [Pseudomonas putida]RFQ01334.1 hypothetical protein D0O09_15825 [Pseudomonas putida]GJB81328.1 hypothetical protein KAM380_057930 [Aeromonas caviae]
MRIIPLSLALATLVAAPGAFAQSSPQAQSWDNEPSGFLGVPFQGDFKAQVAECPDSSPRQSTLCRTSTSDPERYEIHGLPYIPINSGYQLFAALKNGAISQLMLTGNASSLELVDDFLTDTLGQPSSSLSRRIQLSSGASYEMKTISWEGKRVAVHFQRNESDLSRYTVTFTPSAADVKTLGMSSAVDTSREASAVR